MATPTWPAGIIQAPLRESFSDQGPDLTIASQPDIGPPKVRRRGTAGVRTLSCSVVLLHYAEKQVLEDFYYRTLLSGTQAFTWPHVERETGGPGAGGTPALFRITAPPSYRRRGAVGHLADFACQRITPIDTTQSTLSVRQNVLVLS